MVVKRTGDVVGFDSNRIEVAISKAVTAIGDEASEDKVRGVVSDISDEIKERFIDFFPNVENIQDIVEKHLVKAGMYETAKAYILYRAERQKSREEKKELDIEKAKVGRLTIKKRDGRTAIFDIKKVRESLLRAAKGYEEDIDVDLLLKETVKGIYDSIDTIGIEKALILSCVSYIERDPAYSFVASRLFMQKLRKEVIGLSINNENLDAAYREFFVTGIKTAVENELLDEKMGEYDLGKLSEALKIERDELIQFTGIQTLYERYFIKLNNGYRLELLQGFWMRVAMGLALNEEKKEERALEFYELLSSFRYIPSTPTLFNSGSNHPQLSSCYLTTVGDDLHEIFKCIGDNAQLSKWAGGIGNDWSSIRATNALIKSTQAESQGVIPFLKIASDVTAAISRTGKRRGGTCAYLESWHLDVEDFMDLRKNTGDDRRRTHDMNTANWIPDLFMKRVLEGGDWTLFSPEEVPDLHELYGKTFEERYVEYEKLAKEGKMRMYKIIPAQRLWKKMLSMLFETGHPWITFKDPCNIRSPQDHAGVVHSSNLCTEITLNTSKEEVSVCNLGSINLSKHILDGKFDEKLIGETVKSAVRMLDNVIDLNFYPTDEAKNSNLRHRPIGMGIMGFQDALFLMGLNFEDKESLEFSDYSMEVISFNAILASSELAKEKGVYESYEGSKWDRGLFPIDTIELLEKERGMEIEIDKKGKLDWINVREHVKEHGMRNSNVMAIAPTASISTIVGCFPCIEPIYKNIYVKANISGEFTVVNSYLVEDLKKLNLWNQEMLDQIKYHDGNLSLITSLPEEIRKRHKEAFEIDPMWGIELTAARSKWIDQSQSHNVFMQGVSGNKLNDIYFHAWKKGLKTTYYLRSLAASQIEKSTLDTKFGFTQKREYEEVKNNGVVEEKVEQKTVVPDSPKDSLLKKYSFKDSKNGSAEVKLCKIEDPDCEACQ
jgi:ribonucleoside-diphosphate reductase alpha chain